jgi:hypothetical protein
MAKGWKCPHCSTHNPETTLTCAGCGRIQGSVVVTGSTPVTPASSQPSEGWQAAASSWSPGPGSAPGNSLDNTLGDGAPANAAAGGGEPTPSWAVNLDATPPASTPLWRKFPIGWLIVGVLVFGGAIGGLLFNASRSSTGEITRSGDLTANDLRVGDCFDLKDPEAEEVGDVTAHPCTEAHEYEVFYVGSMAAGAFPSEEAMTTFVVDNCGPAYDAYIGKAYADSRLDFSWLSPTDDSWGEGDRSVQCAVYDPENARLTLSLKDSQL